MKSSKTSYTDNVSNVRDRFETLSSIGNSVVSEGAGVVNQFIDLGRFFEYMKRITPEKNKVAYIKDVELNVSAFLIGTADGTEDISALMYSAYLYRTDVPAVATQAALQQRVRNENLIPLTVNKAVVPFCYQLNLAAISARYTGGSQYTHKADVREFAIQPMGLILMMSSLFFAGNAAVTFTVNIGAKIRYEVMSVENELFRRLVLAHTGGPQTIERRGT